MLTDETTSRLQLLLLLRQHDIAVADSQTSPSNEGLQYLSEEEEEEEEEEGDVGDDDDDEEGEERGQDRRQNQDNATSVGTAHGKNTATIVGHFGSKWQTDSREALRAQVGMSRQARAAAGNLLRSRDFDEEAQRNWHSFYRRNTTNFYKDRHYLTRAFPLLGEELAKGPEHQVSFLEVGCGVGNAMLPLAERHPNLRAFGVDFAASAIELLHKRPSFIATNSKAFVCDITCEKLPDDVPTVDAALLLFVASAMHPSKMEQALINVCERLKPGGLLMFRDYAMFDMAQLRFSPEQRLAHNLYVRQDGTQSFFFTLEGLEWLLGRQLGLRCIDSRYVRRVVRNTKLGTKMKRQWINATYIKPV